MRGKTLLVFFVVVLLGCAQQKFDVEASMQLQERAVAGENVKIIISAQIPKNTSATISVLAGTKKFESSCSTSLCLATFEFAPQAGVYIVKAQIMQDAKYPIWETSKRLEVLKSAQNICVNGTEFGKCSEKKPQYCDGGVVVDNCELCECEAGYFCNGKACSARAKAIKLEGLAYPSKVEYNKPFSVRATFLRGEDFEGARYETKISIGGKEYTKEFAVPNDQNFSVSFDGILLAQGNFDLNFSLYTLNEQKELLLTMNGRIISLGELEPPAKTEITQIFAEGSDVVLNWSKVEGAASYTLYKSADANPVFIAYKKYMQFDITEQSAVLQGLEDGTHFFVMTASDDFGNESAYGEPRSVTIE